MFLTTVEWIMSLASYCSQLEPSEDTEIWRFMPLNRFEDLMANEELFFCRSDLFKQDESEGIPPEDYLRRVFNLRKYDIQDEKTLIHQLGMLAQDREMFYVSCWHLARDEKAEMWKGFAESGVAIISRYGLLKATLDRLLDDAHLGLVRYGDDHLNWTRRVNITQYITTKRRFFEDECEVRAFLMCPNVLAGGNRHFDASNWPRSLPLSENPRHHWVHDFKKRRIDSKSLLVGVVVSPWASQEVVQRVNTWLKIKEHQCTIRPSSLTL
jgi:hypothetical protein